jgi:outer membrane protein OmpA-like peptidoglycan-associated protein
VASAQPVPVAMPEQPLTAIENGFSTSIRFRTASADLEPHLARRLTRFAEALDKLPAFAVRLEGFADRRGPQTDNLELSRRRIDAVRAVLLAHGVDAQRIETEAHGENQPLFHDEDPESFDFERRVVITLRESEG